MSRHLLPFLLAACGGPVLSGGDCPIEVSPNSRIEDGVLQGEPCYEHTDAGVDYSLCCPDGTEPVGVNAAGEVVCW